MTTQREYVSVPNGGVVADGFHTKALMRTLPTADDFHAPGRAEARSGSSRATTTYRTPGRRSEACRSGPMPCQASRTTAAQGSTVPPFRRAPMYGMLSPRDPGDPQADDMPGGRGAIVRKAGAEVIIVPTERMPTRRGAAAMMRL